MQGHREYKAFGGCESHLPFSSPLFPGSWWRSSCKRWWSSGQQICRNKTVSSENNLTSEDMPVGRSFIYRRNRTGPRTESCGTPDDTFDQSEHDRLTTTRCQQSDKKSCNHSFSLHECHNDEPWVAISHGARNQRPWQSLKRWRRLDREYWES